MLSFPVFAKLQPGLFPFSSSRRLSRDPLSLLFATHTDSTSCKSFLCHSYENMGGVYQLFPLWNSRLFSRHFFAARALHERKINARIAHFFTITPFLATLAFLVGGEGGSRAFQSDPQLHFSSAPPLRVSASTPPAALLPFACPCKTSRVRWPYAG